MPPGPSCGATGSLKHSLSHFQAVRPSAEAVRRAQLRGYRVQKAFDLPERQEGRDEAENHAQSADTWRPLRADPSGGGEAGASRRHRRDKPAGDVGWGVVAWRDPDQADRCRIPKPHVRGFDKERTQQYVYQ